MNLVALLPSLFPTTEDDWAFYQACEKNLAKKESSRGLIMAAQKKYNLPFLPNQRFSDVLRYVRVKEKINALRYHDDEEYDD